MINFKMFHWVLSCFLTSMCIFILRFSLHLWYCHGFFKQHSRSFQVARNCCIFLTLLFDLAVILQRELNFLSHFSACFLANQEQNHTPIASWSPAISRALGFLLLVTLSSHWRLMIYLFVLIGRRDYFGFSLTTCNRKAV